MNVRSDNTRGWIGTLAFHLLVALILFLWKVDLTTSQPEFIELSFNTSADIRTTPPTRPSPPASSRKAVAAPRVPRGKPLDLPERRFAKDDEPLRLPATSKLAADDRPGRVQTQKGNIEGRKDIGPGTGSGEKEKLATRGLGQGGAEVADPVGSGFVGTNIGTSVSMSMLWSDGGTRRMVSGDLPEYPEGVKVEAQIKVELVVLPDGSVKSLRPFQKGNMKLEEAALKETRHWRFEPLRASAPQRDQTCVVTFNFRLR
jgi:TonB family protein